MSRTRSEKYNKCVQLYEQGMSIGIVANYFCITRQAMWDILKRRGCKFRKKEQYSTDNRFYRGTRADGKAQNMLEYAVRKGKVIRKYRCDSCGESGTFKDGRTSIQAHHQDYSKPLDVMWLCQRCHHKWHKENKAKGGDAK